PPHAHQPSLKSAVRHNQSRAAPALREYRSPIDHRTLPHPVDTQNHCSCWSFPYQAIVTQSHVHQPDLQTTRSLRWTYSLTNIMFHSPGYAAGHLAVGLDATARHCATERDPW